MDNLCQCKLSPNSIRFHNRLYCCNKQAWAKDYRRNQRISCSHNLYNLEFPIKLLLRPARRRRRVLWWRRKLPIVLIRNLPLKKQNKCKRQKIRKNKPSQLKLRQAYIPSRRSMRRSPSSVQRKNRAPSSMTMTS